jgi:hypothetical protein
MREEAAMVTLHMTHLRDGVNVAPARRLPDVREEPVGTFLGQVPPDALVGSFGNVPRFRRRGAGTFRGDPERQRQGSFGDHDLTEIDDRGRLGERFVRVPDAA